MRPASGALVALLAAVMAGHPAASAAQLAPPRWRGTIDLTIGGADANDDASFGRVSGVAVDRAGRIFVADGQDNQVRMFSPGGAFVARIGRMGSGPMEFKTLGAITIVPDGFLWTRDEGNARILALDVSAAKPREAKNVPLLNFSGDTRRVIAFLPDGSLVDEKFWYDQASDNVIPIRIRRTLSGTVSRMDTLPVPKGAYAGVYKVNEPQKDASGKTVGLAQYYVWQPFGPQWVRAYGPGGLRADAVTSQYDVRIYDASEQLLRTLKRTVPPVALSPRERKTADSALGWYKMRLPFGVPAAKTPIAGLVWSQDGQLWVERSVADGRPREADVYDQAGRWIAIAEWPATIDLRVWTTAITGQTVTTAARDSSDVERIVRMRFR